MPVYRESVLFEALGVDKAERNISRLDKALQDLIRTSKSLRGDSDPFASMAKSITASRSSLTGLIKQLQAGESAARKMADQMARLTAVGGNGASGGPTLPGRGSTRAPRPNEREQRERQAAFNPHTPAAFTLNGRPVYESGLGAAGIQARTNALRGLAAMERDAARAQQRAEQDARRRSEREENANDRGGRGGGRGGGHGFNFQRELNRFSPGSLALHITAATAYLTASKIEHAAVEGAKEQSTARERLLQMGYAPDRIARATGMARRVSDDWRTTSTASNLETLIDISAAVHGENEQEKVVRMLAARQQALVGQGRDAAQVRDENIRLIKTLEMTGQLVDSHGHFNESRTRERMDAIRQVESVEGGNIDARQIQQAAKYMRTLGLTENTDNFKRALFFAAEMGGSSSGVGFDTAVRNLTGHATKGALSNLVNQGIATAEFTTTKEGKQKMVPGTFRIHDEDLLRSDFGMWMEKNIMPLLAKQGIDPKSNPAAVSSFLSTIMSHRTGVDFMFKNITQLAELQNKMEASNKVRTDDETARGTTKRDYNAAAVELGAQAKELFGNLGESLKGVLIPAINAASGGLHTLASYFADDQSTAAKFGAAGAVAAGGIGLMGAGAAGKWAVGKLLNPFAGVTIATDANTVATNANTEALLGKSASNAAKKVAENAAPAAAGGGLLGAILAGAAPSAIIGGLSFIAAGKHRPEEVVKAEQRMGEINRELTTLNSLLASGNSSDPAKTQAKIDALQAEFNQQKEIATSHASKTAEEAAKTAINTENANTKLDAIHEAIKSSPIGTGAGNGSTGSNRGIDYTPTGSLPPGGGSTVGSSVGSFASGSNGTASGRGIEEAAGLVGRHERRDNALISKYLRTGGHGMNPADVAWCAAFVGATLEKDGIKSIPASQGGSVANNYLNWGVRADMSKGAKRDDVVVFNRGLGVGRTGGHVGILTGRMNGNMAEYLEGNSENRVRRDWVDVNAKNAQFRRSLTTSLAAMSPADDHSGAASEMKQAARDMRSAVAMMPSQFDVRAQVKREPNVGSAGSME